LRKISLACSAEKKAYNIRQRNSSSLNSRLTVENVFNKAADPPILYEHPEIIENRTQQITKRLLHLVSQKKAEDIFW